MRGAPHCSATPVPTTGTMVSHDIAGSGWLSGCLRRERPNVPKRDPPAERAVRLSTSGLRTCVSSARCPTFMPRRFECFGTVAVRIGSSRFDREPPMKWLSPALVAVPCLASLLLVTGCSDNGQARGEQDHLRTQLATTRKERDDATAAPE